MRSYLGREDLPPPRPVVALFVCDGCEGGLFPPTELRIELRTAESFAWDIAVAAGWVVTPERDLGPCCSGKTPHKETDDGDH